MKEPFFTVFLRCFSALTRRTGRIQVAILIVGSFLVGGFLSLYLGQDANYDFKKYHIYNAWAFLNNRLETDFFAAGLQTYYHPLLDIPCYLLAVEWLPEHPRLVTFLMGIPAGIIIFLTTFCAFQILKTACGVGRPLLFFYTFLVSFFGVTGTAFIIQVGSGTNEVQVACFILGGMAVFLLYKDRPIPASLLSGLLLGAGTGLKLTAVTYTVPFLVALLFYFSWRERGRVFLLFCVAWWTAFLCVYAGWGWTLYKLTGNPFFPMFNNVFRSEWLPSVALPGSWFTPTSLKEALFFPFAWVNSRAISASHATDIRFALAQTAAFVAVVVFALHKLRSALRKEKFSMLFSSEGARAEKEKKTANFVFIFLALGFVIWEAGFSVLRYTIPLESLLGVLILLCVFRVFTLFNLRVRTPKHLLATSLLLVFIILALGTTRYPHWGRVRQGKANFEVAPPKLPDNTLVFFLAPEAQFLAPFIAKKNPDVTFAGAGDDPRFLLEAIGDCGLTRRLHGKLASHDGPFCVILPSGYPGHLSFLASFGLSTAGNLHETVKTNFDNFRFYLAFRKDWEPAKKAAAHRYFVENVMTRFNTRFTHESDSPFWGGWAPKESKHRWSLGGISAFTFFVKESKNTPKKIIIKGRPLGQQCATVKLNSKEIFTGEIPQNGFPEFVPPAGLIRTVENGENRLDFIWHNARKLDNRPWPLNPRPHSGDQRLLAFAFQEFI
ncbi:MAG: hypothetical protein LBS59_04500, partial [Puniceicoccales bacterium]|nr:hypothetical protein [Puniceicoccales bacterium]